jgi:hypothetical protein
MNPRYNSLMEEIVERRLSGTFSEQIIGDIQDQLNIMNDEDFKSFFGLLGHINKIDSSVDVQLMEFFLGVEDLSTYVEEFLSSIDLAEQEEAEAPYPEENF